MIWEVSRENRVYGAKSKESLPRSESNVSWCNYVEFLENSSWDLSKYSSIVYAYIYIYILIHTSSCL